MKNKVCLLLSIFVICITVSGCSIFDDPKEAVVRKMYTTLGKGDMDGYMDTILPDNRRQPNLFGLASALSISVDPIGFDLGGLLQFTISDMKYLTVFEDDTYALVQVEGKIRYSTLAMEYGFCDMHDLRFVDGDWYIDIYAPERQERLTRILAKRVSESEQMRVSPNPQDYQQMWGLYMDLTEQMLDMCED